MRFFAPFTLLALGCSFANATPLPSCTAFANLQQFVDAGSSGCTYGSVVLNSFAWTDTGGVSDAVVAASAVDVTISTNPALSTFSLAFASTGFTETTQSLAYQLAYKMVPSSAFIRQAAASLANVTVNTGDGGAVSLQEAVANGTTTTFLNPSSPSWNDSSAVTGASFTITNSLAITPGAVTSSSISGFSNIYTVPEPGSWLFVGTGLMAVGLSWRRLFAK